MSKQSDAKERQGYIQKAIRRECSTCIHLEFDVVEYPNGYKAEEKIRCGIGGFAAKKQGVCNLHEFKQNS